MYKTKPTGDTYLFDRYVSGNVYATITGAAIAEVGNMVKGLWRDREYKHAIIATLEFPLIVWATRHYGMYGNNKDFVEEV